MAGYHDYQSFARLEDRIACLNEQLRTARAALGELNDIRLSVVSNPADRVTIYGVTYRMREQERYQLRSDSAIVQAVCDGVTEMIRRDFDNVGTKIGKAEVRNL